MIGGIYARIFAYIRTGRINELPNLLPSLIEFAMSSFTAGGTPSARAIRRQRASRLAT